MNKLLATCLLSLSISSTALATEGTQGSADWLSQNTAPLISAAPMTNPGVNVRPPEGNDIQEVLNLGMQMLDTVNSGKMRLVLGMLLMILIWGLKTLWESLPPSAVPWVTAGIATVGAAAFGMLSGWPWEKILTDALTVSTSAGGLWSLIGKHVSDLGRK
tara:strand:+ start:91 stop:570 length:480 start_codon:yes stop_codon:yes gene_type:complete